MSDYVITPDGELYHHGIKGMKWGIRRFQNRDGTLTAAGRKRYDDDRNVIKKGTAFDRISTAQEKKANKGRTYVTYTDEDHDYYKENMTKYRRSLSGEGTKIYDVTYKNMRDIVYPSHKKQVDEFVKLYSKNKKMVADQVSMENASRYLESVYGIKFSKKDVEKTDIYKALKDEMLSYDEKQLRSEGYNQFIKTYSDLPVSKIYQKNLTRQGYNAIMDDNDIMNNTMDTINPKNSLIVFSGRKYLESIGFKELSDKDYKEVSERNKLRRRGK